jgi:catechol 2,3-dioxygenase-like lactoylglutathione lyase family enzyme
MLTRILESALYAENLEESEAFYRDVLGLQLATREAGHYAFFQCGAGMLLLFNPNTAGCPEVGIPRHGAKGQGHLAFAIAEEEFPSWRERLAAHGVPIESEVDWPVGAHSIYFRDPAGNSLELTLPRLWGLE